MVDILEDSSLCDLISFSDEESWSDCFVSSSSCSDECEEVVVSKRRRIRKRKPKEPVINLRVLRSDIRRSYSIMLANVINSCDYSLIF